MFRFHPRPTIFPSHTITAPTGISPASRARCAERTASCIQSSSEAAVGCWPLVVDNSPLGFGERKGRLADILAAADEYAVDLRDSAARTGAWRRIGFPQTG